MAKEQRETRAHPNKTQGRKGRPDHPKTTPKRAAARGPHPPQAPKRHPEKRKRPGPNLCARPSFYAPLFPRCCHRDARHQSETGGVSLRVAPLSAAAGKALCSLLVGAAVRDRLSAISLRSLGTCATLNRHARLTFSHAISLDMRVSEPLPLKLTAHASEETLSPKMANPLKVKPSAQSRRVR